MIEASIRESFPYRLTTFEEYMLVDQSDENPMTFQFILEFDSPLETKILESAIKAVAPLHPLLYSKVELKNGVPYWVLDPDSIESIFQIVDSRPPIQKIDLTQRTGLSISWLSAENSENLSNSEPNQNVLIFTFHHSVADGIATIQLIQQILVQYDCRIRKADHEKRLAETDFRFEPKSFLSRDKFSGSLWKFYSRIIQNGLGSLGLLEFRYHRILPVGKFQLDGESFQPTNKSKVDTCQADHKSLEISADGFQHLKKVAKQNKVSLNDLLLAIVYRVLGQHMIRREGPKPDGYLRLMVPTNLREFGDCKCVANVVSMISLDRRPWRFKKFKSFIKNVSLEMKAIKFLRVGTVFIHLLNKLLKKENGIKWLLPDNKCAATAVVSNLGRAFYGCELVQGNQKLTTGNSSLLSMSTIGPLRPYTTVFFAVNSYDSKFFITMNYSKTHLSEEDAVQLASDLKEQLYNPLT